MITAQYLLLDLIIFLYLVSLALELITRGILSINSELLVMIFSNLLQTKHNFFMDIEQYPNTFNRMSSGSASIFRVKFVLVDSKR